MSACFFPFPILITLTFPSTITTSFVFEVWSCYNSTSLLFTAEYHVEENVTHKVNYYYCFHFSSQELIQLPERVEGLPCEGRGDVRILK
jgi:hypothetical protein